MDQPSIRKKRLGELLHHAGLITESDLLKAIKERASDIHIEALRASLAVSLRVDAILKEDMSLPKWVQGSLVSRIKILASLDIAERRLPQDGAIRVKLENRDIDL